MVSCEMHITIILLGLFMLAIGCGVLIGYGFFYKE